MWMWCTAAVYSFSSWAFVSRWVLGKKPSFLALAVSLAAGSLAAWIPGWSLSARFLASLTAGSLCWILYHLISHRLHLLQAACVIAAAILPWSPMLLCRTVIWEYCLVAAGMLLCLLMAIGERLPLEETAGKPQRYIDDKLSNLLLTIFPLLMLPAAWLLLYWQKALAFGPAAAYCLLLFGFCGLILCLQEQIRGRIAAQRMNTAFGRWQRESRDYMNTIRSQRHDFNLHMHAISGLISSGEYDECRNYVQKLVADAAAINDIMPVADAVVGSMLYNMREQARRKGSDITYHITYDMEDVVCNGFECNKIIGNLLQNAIDALQTPEDLAFGIHASIFKRRGYTVITVENRFTGDKDAIARAFEPGYSTKQKHDGIGLPMVLRTVAQYAGRIYPEFEDERIRFVVNIPNRLTLKEEATS